MFWSCSKLVNFWQLIFNFLSEVLAIFGLTTELCLDNNTKNMISFSTLIARRLILHKWKAKLHLLLVNGLGILCTTLH